MVTLRYLRGTQVSEQLLADALKGLLQQIQTITKSLVSGQRGKPFSPIIADETIDLNFCEFLIEMPEKPDRDQFLVGKFRISIIAPALKTSVGTSIVNLTDKQIKFD